MRNIFGSDLFLKQFILVQWRHHQKQQLKEKNQLVPKNKNKKEVDRRRPKWSTHFLSLKEEPIKNEIYYKDKIDVSESSTEKTHYREDGDNQIFQGNTN